jgi:hypothetical protein
MPEFLLKRTQNGLWFDLGGFNLFALAVLLPVFWFQYLSRFCVSHCCCGQSFEPFYQGNFTRMLVVALSMLGFLALDSVYLRLILDRQSLMPGRTKGHRYLRWRLLQSLPLLLMLLAVMALPIARLIYFALAFISLCLILGPEGNKISWRPSFALAGRTQNLIPRHHLKGLLVYLGILLIVIPGLFFSRAFACDCAKISSTKANMHTLQTIVETYAVDSGGLCPDNLAKLKAQGQAPGREYWKDFNNPFTRLKGEGKSYAMLPLKNDALVPNPSANLNPFRDILGIRIYHDAFMVNSTSAGMVFYDRVSPSKYYIYGTDKTGGFIMDKGELFTLTNS